MTLKLLAAGLLAAALLFGAPSAEAQVAELGARGIVLSIDRKDVSVSGISSGAAMAHQIHVARSKDLVGVGMVAGPPFRCADYFKGDPANPVTSDFTAVYLCTGYYKKLEGVPPTWAGGPVDASRLKALAEDAFRRRTVDPRSGLCGDRVFLIAGGLDTTVPSHVSAATKGLYDWLLSDCAGSGKGRVTDVTIVEMPHTMPTDVAVGRACVAGPPYIADCDFAGAEQMLRHLHPAKAAAPQANRPASRDNLIRFDQHRVIGATEPKGLMHQAGYVYVPESCKQGRRCSLHIALHGCHQNEDMINEGVADPTRPVLFAADAGYNGFAERNGIVVLYPQAAGTGAAGGNPNGCWDWWGYNGVDFYQKGARQIRNIWTLVEALSR